MRGGAAGPATELVVAAWGWDHPAWVGPFYPEGMPADWRLAYYAHAFRAVVVPAAVLAAASPEEVAGWAADAPPPFVFHAEFGPPYDPADPASVADLMARLAPLAGQVGSVLLEPQGPVPDPTGLRLLAARWPLLWLEPPGPGAADAGLAASFDVVWRPGAATPAQGGPVCLGLMDAAARSPRELRAALEGFLGAVRACPRAFLCFPGVAWAWRQMQQARVIAELLVG